MNHTKSQSNKNIFIIIVVIVLVIAGVVFLQSQPNNATSGGSIHSSGVLQGNNAGE